jgi:hypothetical protein
MIRLRIIGLLFVASINMSIISSANAEVLSRAAVACKNWEWFMEWIWLVSLAANGAQYIEPHQTAEKWVESGKCAWLTKGTMVTILDRLPLHTVQVRPVGSLHEYTLSDDALIPQTTDH